MPGLLDPRARADPSADVDAVLQHWRMRNTATHAQPVLLHHSQRQQALMDLQHRPRHMGCHICTMLETALLAVRACAGRRAQDSASLLPRQVAVPHQLLFLAGQVTSSADMAAGRM
jgi:hypothetical protein